MNPGPSTDMTAAQDARCASLAKTPSELLQEARLGLPPAREAAVLARLAEMPQNCRLTYLRGMKGDSRAAAVKSFCQMCMGWHDLAREIEACMDPACPLYPYRPYQGTSRAIPPGRAPGDGRDCGLQGTEAA